MNRVISVLLTGLFCMLSSMEGLCEPSFQEAGLLRGSRVEGREEYSFLHALPFLKMLPQLRFFGNYVNAKGSFSRHPAIKSEGYPGDAFSALIQYLFPSPDGAILAYNQRNDDPVGEIAKGKRFDILNDLIEIAILGEKDLGLTEEVLEERILEVFELGFEGRYKERWDGIVEKVQALKDKISFVPSVDTKFSEQSLVEVRGSFDQKVMELEVIEQDTQKEIDKIKKNSNKYTQDKEISNLKNEYGRLYGSLLLSNKQSKILSDLSTRVRRFLEELALTKTFARILAEAIIQDRQSLETRIYPPHSVVYSLLAFAWKMADSANDLKTLKSVVSEQTPTLSKPFSEKEYYEGMEGFLKRINDKHSPEIIPPEEIILFLEGYNQYQKPIPPLITYSSDAGYPDCGETSLRNLFYILLGKRGIVSQEDLERFFDRIHFPKDVKRIPLAIEKLLNFFKKYPNISMGGTAQAHKDWSHVVCDLNTRFPDLTNEITYRNKNGTNLPGYGGIINMLSVIGALIPDEVLSRPWTTGTDEKVFDGNGKVLNPDNLTLAAEKLTRLCELFSWEEPEGGGVFSITWDCYGAQELIRSTNIEITFLVNGNPSFKWIIEDSHFEILSLEDSENDPSKNISITNSFLKNHPLLQTCVLSSLEGAFDDWDHLRPYHVWNLRMRDFEDATLVMDLILEKQWTPLYPTMKHMLDKSVSWADWHASDRMQPLLVFYKDVLKKYVSDIEEKMDAPEMDDPLQEACLNGYLGLSRLILTQSPDQIHLKNGNTPLHRAVFYRRKNTVKLLLNHHDVDVNIKNSMGDTPLHIAVQYESADPTILKLLLAHPKIDPNIPNKNEKIPLQEACFGWRINKDLIKILVNEPKVNVNVKDSEENTVLHYAIQCGWSDIVQDLLSRDDTDVNVINSKGKTALLIASEDGDEEIVSLLLNNRRIEMNAGGFPYKRCWATPLTLAIKKGHKGIVKLLLGHGAYVNQQHLYMTQNEEINTMLEEAHDKQYEKKNIDHSPPRIEIGK